MDDKPEIAAGASDMPGRFVAETNAFLSRHWSDPNVGWPRKLDSDYPLFLVRNGTPELAPDAHEIIAAWAETAIPEGMQSFARTPLLERGSVSSSGGSIVLIFVDMEGVSPPSEASRQGQDMEVGGCTPRAMNARPLTREPATCVIRSPARPGPLLTASS